LESAHARRSAGLAEAHPGRHHDRGTLQRDRGLHADDPVDDQLTAALEAPHGRVGPRPREAVDPPGPFARARERNLNRAHVVEVMKRGVASVAWCGGSRRASDEQRPDEASQHAAHKCDKQCPPTHRGSFLERITPRAQTRTTARLVSRRES
jgi:hypothetical protein